MTAAKGHNGMLLLWSQEWTPTIDALLPGTSEQQDIFHALWDCRSHWYALVAAVVVVAAFLALSRAATVPALASRVALFSVVFVGVVGILVALLAMLGALLSRPPSTLSLPIWAWNPVYCLIETLCLIVVRAVAKLCCWELIIVLPEAETFDLFLSSTYKIRRWLKAMSQCSVSLRLPLMERSWKTCCHYGRPVAFHSGPMPLQLNIFGTASACASFKLVCCFAMYSLEQL